MRRARRRFKSFKQLHPPIARTAVEELDELPAEYPPGWVDHEPLKTALRLAFEARPALPMRRPEKGLLDDYYLATHSDGPVDARWQRVCWHAHRRGPCSIYPADNWIDAGVKYLNAYLDCRDDVELEDLDRRMPHLHAAYSLYRSEDKFLRGRLEGYLLTSRSFDEVGNRCKLSPAAVEAYEALFFDVRRHAKQFIHICHAAFDGKYPFPAKDSGLTEDDVDIHLRTAGFLRGGVFLEPMIHYYSSGWQIPGGQGCPSRTEIMEMHDMIAMRGLILAWVLAPSKIGRVLLLADLVAELEKLIDVWPDGASAPKKSPFGGAPITDEQLSAWWTSWRKTIRLAAGNLPAAPARQVA